MNGRIYRIQDTITDEPYSDVMGPALISSYTAACFKAGEQAKRTGNPWSVIRISGAGQVKCVRVVNPS